MIKGAVKGAGTVDSPENVDAEPGFQSSADDRGDKMKEEFHLPPRLRRR